MKKKKMIFILLIIIVLIATTIFLIVTNTSKHDILSRKFYIHIKRSYEIIHFENIKKDREERHCYAALKLNETEFSSFESKLKKKYYQESDIEMYKPFFERNKEWICSDGIISVYENQVVEFLGNRIGMTIFITKPKDGYLYVYMTRN